MTATPRKPDIRSNETADFESRRCVVSHNTIPASTWTIQMMGLPLLNWLGEGLVIPAPLDDHPGEIEQWLCEYVVSGALTETQFSYFLPWIHEFVRKIKESLNMFDIEM